MNCGLGNLTTLKKSLLGESLWTSKQFDLVLAGIGLGVAGMFDAYCNRELVYAENFTEIFMGNRAYWFVKKYPFIAIAKVELKYFATDSWTDITAQPLIINPETGMLNFGYTLGPAPIQVRVTYNGGYWFQTLEDGQAGYLVCDVSTDGGYPGALPAAIQGSPNLNPPGIEPFKFLLPTELRTAWLLQCGDIWAARDKLGLGAMDTPNAQSKTAQLEISPLVKTILQRYIRYQLT